MTTDITELAQSLKAAAEKAGADYWQAKKISGDFYVIRKGSYKRECGYTTYQPIAEIDHKPTRDYVALANPANVLALVEALEYYKSREERVTSLVRDNSKSWDELYRQVEAKGKRNVELVEALASEKRICATWRKTAEANSEKLEKAQRYIEELREWNAGLAQESCERQQRISELLEGKVGNSLLERENHHVELIGKLTERIAELESRVVSVKLTDINEYLTDVHDKTLSLAFRRLAEAVRAGDVEELRAAGIKVEVE